ncbi:MAG: chromosome partitioning protein [Deltaproteobacteria bacterium RBG_19FT_COMBO_46_12]|nr:MAG: chromosome partitioning protein [Deltaproteobacteria bacterium RBG_19FT_COMBO_46_12]
MKITKEQVLDALKSVMDPDLKKDVVSLGFIKELQIEGGRVSFIMELTTPACPLKEQLKTAAEQAVRGIAGVSEVQVEVSSKVSTHRVQMEEEILPGVRNIIAIASGKGGVGKSTVCVSLAVALARTGARVGLLDTDIYGPSIPIMMGVKEQPELKEQKLIPIIRYGVKLMSIGFLISEDTPLIWRGPMVMKAVEQLLMDVDWGELDYLMIDLPPGTGDVQLTLAQKVPMTGVVIVTTPQDVALLDVVRGISMFKKLNVPILGIIENMSFFQCPHCGERTEIFSHGGGEAASRKLEVPFLGEVPIDLKTRTGGDTGRPVVIDDPESGQSKIFMKIAEQMAARISTLSVG